VEKRNVELGFLAYRFGGLGRQEPLSAKKYSPADSLTYRRAVPPWAHYVWSEFGLIHSGLMSASRARVQDRLAL